MAEARSLRNLSIWLPFIWCESQLTALLCWLNSQDPSRSSFFNQSPVPSELAVRLCFLKMNNVLIESVSLASPWWLRITVLRIPVSCGCVRMPDVEIGRARLGDRHSRATSMQCPQHKIAIFQRVVHAYYWAYDFLILALPAGWLVTFSNEHL